MAGPPPVFLLGAHRSGTTLLYGLLAETGAFTPLTALDVIRWPERRAAALDGGPPPSPAALQAELDGLGLVRRATDEVPVGPDTPEEYGYILLRAGLKSWLTPPALPLLREIVDVLQRAHPDRPVLLKNPWDYGGEAQILRAFPDARFLTVHRHPIAVVGSSVRLFRRIWAAPDPYTALLSPRYRRLWAGRYSRALFQWLASPRNAVDLHITLGGLVGAHARHARWWGAGRGPTLRYEDLCADPVAEVARLLAGLGLPPAAAPTTATTPRPVRLDPELEPHRWLINWRTRGYRARWGYAPDGGVLPRAELPA